MTQERRTLNCLMSGVSDRLSATRALKQNQFSITEMFAEVGRSHAIAAGQKGLALFFSVDPNVPRVMAGQPARLRRILDNLVENAVRYTSQGEVVLSAVVAQTLHPARRSESRWGGELEVAVHDTGAGIDASRLQALLDNTAGARGGTAAGGGDGLAVASHLAVLMGGWLDATSTPGQGSMFRVRIPCDVVRPAVSPLMSEVENAHVLLIIQNKAFAQQLERLLCDGGLRPDVVTDSDMVPAMLAAAKDGIDPYDFIIVDMEMLGAGEFDLSAHFHDASPWLDRILVLLPAHTLGRDLAHCHALGLTSCLPKPFSARELHDVLLQACVNNQMLYELAMPEFDPERMLIEMLWKHAASTPRFHVLLVENSAADQVSIIKTLEHAGHRVTVTDSGGAAIETCAAQRFDAVLMSLQLPGMTGLEAAQAILTQESCYRTQIWSGVQTTPIIALSTRPDRGEYARCREVGIAGYVRKPLHSDELLDVLRQVCDSVMGGVSGLCLAAGAEDRQGGIDHYRSSVAATLAHQVMNLDDTREMFGANSAVITELLDVFFEGFTLTLENLKVAYAEEDLPRLAQLAHTVKGSVGIFGAQRAAEAARRVEAVARTTEDPAGVRVPLMYLLQEMEALSDALRTVAQKE